ncbi:hypothetical protein B0H16DRAFT_1770086 [Mycena metata]|uniref:Uncharacterized protein n=1 Tax=Mycena metata TaxID=1033252 RepID=A0AAD7I155_9AGAR|nr:hypothetical protein B0H16DRAFT_1770086 [Mycena metata]
MAMKSVATWTDEARKRAQRKAVWEMTRKRMLLDGRSEPWVDTVLLEQDVGEEVRVIAKENHLIAQPKTTTSATTRNSTDTSLRTVFTTGGFLDNTQEVFRSIECKLRAAYTTAAASKASAARSSSPYPDIDVIVMAVFRSIGVPEIPPASIDFLVHLLIPHPPPIFSVYLELEVRYQSANGGIPAEKEGKKGRSVGMSTTQGRTESSPSLGPVGSAYESERFEATGKAGSEGG